MINRIKEVGIEQNMKQRKTIDQHHVLSTTTQTINDENAGWIPIKSEHESQTQSDWMGATTKPKHDNVQAKNETHL